MTPTQLFWILTILNKLFTSIRYVEWYHRFLSASADGLFAAPSQIREKYNQFLRELVLCHAPIRQGADTIFAAIFQIWDQIPQDVIDNLCESFPARCQVCVELSGSSLNRH
jgi:hypothetical protein